MVFLAKSHSYNPNCSNYMKKVVMEEEILHIPVKERKARWLLPF